MRKRYIQSPIRYRNHGFYYFLRNNRILLVSIIVLLGLSLILGGIFILNTKNRQTQVETNPTPSPENTPTYAQTPTPTPTATPTAGASPAPTVDITPTPTPTLTPGPSGPTPNPGDFSKTVYLTFDDGPSQLTPEILDTLLEKNVKATFFMVGERMTYSKYKDIVLRVKEEGHLIACHTYTHVYDSVYRKNPDGTDDVSGMTSELDQFEAAYESIFGEKMQAKVFRFPGGSTTKKKNSKEPYLELLSQRGYVAYDWNVINGDGTYSGEELKAVAWDTFVDTFTQFEARKKNRPIIILMHDMPSKQATADILPQMIDYITQKGYTFSTLADYPPENVK